MTGMAGTPFVSDDVPMLSDVLDRLGSVPGLTPIRRRDLRSAVRSVARLIGFPPESVPANLGWLGLRMRRIHPAEHNLSEKRFANMKSGVIKALELTSCSRSRSDWLRQPSPAWSALLEKIGNTRDRWKLVRLAQFCTALGIDPDGIEDEQLRGLLRALVEESLASQPERRVADAIRTWNRMRREIAGWPDIELARLPRKKEPWTFPLEAFPASFQADVEAWLDRLRNPDIFDESGPAKPLRPSTIDHRAFQVRQVASALVRSGTPIEEVTSLGVLVDLANLKAALRWMMARFDGNPTEAIKGIAVCLQSIARHHVGVGETDLGQIRGIVGRLGHGTQGLREKNRQRLMQLEDPHKLAKLLHLPSALVSKARREKRLRPHKAARMLQAALAIEILLNAPMRVSNLCSIDLERHLRPLRRGRGRTTHIHFPPEEVKNARALDYELGPEATRLLELYLSEARPLLLESPSTALFPATDGGHKTPKYLSSLIKGMIREHTGLVIHAHLFRSIAGKIHNLAAPGDFVTLSHVLNDSLATTMKAYAQFERRASLEHYQNSVIAARKAGGR